jgi:1,2-diacylglycerol 3-alpha-glucosyltransferase
MNIALFTDCYVPIKNGVVTSVQQLKNGLESKGHHVIVITVEVPYHKDKEKNIYRLPSVKAGLGTEQRFALFNQTAITRFLKKQRIDLIHSHTEFSVGYSAKWTAKKLKIPHIHTTHTMWEDYRHYIMNGRLLSSKMTKRILKTFLTNINALVAPSIKAEKYYRQLSATIPIHVVHNGIDMNKFKSSPITDHEIQQLRKEFGIREKDRTVIFVGRVGREKRVHELYDALLPILERHDNIKLLFVGDGPALPDLLQKTRELDLSKKIVFTGFVNWDLVYRLYSISDIFVTASLSEVHPMTLIEASMCGLPLICRRDDSCLDLVHEGVNGHLVEFDSAITEKVHELLEDPKLLDMFSQASLELSKSFTASEHVNKMEALYEKIIDEYPVK